MNEPTVYHNVEISTDDMAALRAIENYFRFQKKGKLAILAFQVIRRITKQVDPPTNKT